MSMSRLSSHLLAIITVGLLVNFVLPADCAHAGEIRPAIITRVGSTDSFHTPWCNLSVVKDGPNDPDVLPWYGSVPLDQDDQKPGTWHFTEESLTAATPAAVPAPVAELSPLTVGGKRASADAIAQAAYDAYCADAGGKSLISGQPLPKWEALTLPVQHAWVVASEAAIAAEWIDTQPPVASPVTSAPSATATDPKPITP
jgi:hypothetical protein